jgi:hypothetical protein
MRDAPRRERADLAADELAVHGGAAEAADVRELAQCSPELGSKKGSSCPLQCSSQGLPPKQRNHRPRRGIDAAGEAKTTEEGSSEGIGAGCNVPLSDSAV